LKIVHVVWKDPAFARSGWMIKSEFKEWIDEGLARTDSVGLLAYESDEFIVLLQSAGKSEVASAVKISRAAISEMKELGEIEVELKLED
jgi:hypothetical protein